MNEVERLRAELATANIKIRQYDQVLSNVRAERDAAIESRESFRSMEADSYSKSDRLRARLDRVRELAETWEVAPITNLEILRALLDEGDTP